MILTISFQSQAGPLDGIKRILGHDRIVESDKKEVEEKRLQEIANLNEKIELIDSFVDRAKKCERNPGQYKETICANAEADAIKLANMGVSFLTGASRDSISELYSENARKLSDVKSDALSRINLLKGQRRTASFDSEDNIDTPNFERTQTATAPTDEADKQQTNDDNCTNCG